MNAVMKGFLFATCLAFTALLHASDSVTLTTGEDPHYTSAGFFDIHVCNWPKRDLFFLTLFSTYHFKNLKRVSVFDSKGQHIGDIPLTRFRLVQKKGKPEKRVFITQIDVPKNSPEGWYTAKAIMNDGSEVIARDYVVLESMQIALKPSPANKAEDIPMPTTLSWNKIPGATYYQVFIRDMWEGKVIHQSRLLKQPEFRIPKGLLQAGGWYKWRVHARDVNENVILGDFNHGSLSDDFSFTVADK